jgi:hypothetical protein
MFMRVDSKCAHQVRPPFGLTEPTDSGQSVTFDRELRSVRRRATRSQVAAPLARTEANLPTEHARKVTLIGEPAPQGDVGERERLPAE